jgi:hypothetical protein
LFCLFRRTAATAVPLIPPEERSKRIAKVQKGKKMRFCLKQIVLCCHSIIYKSQKKNICVVFFVSFVFVCLVDVVLGAVCDLTRINALRANVALEKVVSAKKAVKKGLKSIERQKQPAKSNNKAKQQKVPFDRYGTLRRNAAAQKAQPKRRSAAPQQEKPKARTTATQQKAKPRKY